MELRSTAMELLPLVCLCLLTWSGTTFADGNEPKIIGVTEGSDVTLPCSLSSREDIQGKRFEWKKDGQEVFLYDGSPLSGQDLQFKGRVSYFKEELRNGNASITIRDTKRADNGIYTCDFPYLQPKRQTFHIKLVFGAASKPSIITFNGTKDGVLLQCDVQGASPKPLVQWQDSSGNILPAKDPQVSERGGRYDIILQTTVTISGYYRCVATQKEINHQIYHETHVSVPVSLRRLVQIRVLELDAGSCL
ncbi:butyrophilin-like protein 1 [Lates calcarifer]|uniref:Butyrophilin-like protein 1 n=1 Tax=Lates calcarifer TaxID=8187 RepID=A0AAJ8DL23_LATCA|nr:butyrophilin-like protein 1 [Lates calcarifer]